MGVELGFRSVFFISSGLFLLVSVWVWNAMKRIQLEEPEKKRLRDLLKMREWLHIRLHRKGEK